MMSKSQEIYEEGITKKQKIADKPKASRKIIFADDNQVEFGTRGSNNNASNLTNKKFMSKQNKGNNGKEKQLLDPCFRNVWNKEKTNCDQISKTNSKNVAQGRKVKVVVMGDKMNQTMSNGNVNETSNLIEQGTSQANNEEKRDGISIDVEGIADEELDYVDDLVDEEMSEFEDDLVHDNSDDSVSQNQKVMVKSVSKRGSKTTKEVNKGNSLDKTASSDLTDEELANHPRVKTLFDRFWAEKMHESNKNRNKNLQGEKEKLNDRSDVVNNSIKSPSDTTIYAPALVKSPVGVTGRNDKNDRNINEIVANFVDTVRIEQDQIQLQENERRRASIDDGNTAALNEARSKADKAILEAEKFRATISTPDPGRNTNYDVSCMEEIQNPHLTDSQLKPITEFDRPVNPPQVQLGPQSQDLGILHIGSGVSDDDFFHLTCHIDPSLIHKIEKGEFIELEKLIPKEKLGRTSDENRLEWVQRDGGTYLVPAQCDSKIGSFRKWEQAFRAYATIYCGANPHRAKEIWQYITVINTAANSYLWDNVYNYDITFRHLMAFNPTRSWAVTYNQMWNLSMRDPIPRANGQKPNVFQHQANGLAGQKGFGQGNQGNQSGAKRKASDYCWNFNKGIPCKFGARCKFVERCKYCDSPSHGVNNCFKLQKKNEGQVGSNGQRVVQETATHSKNQVSK